jgi:hypothetical protein
MIRKWKPWENSTGAKTSAGKEKSKMNAFKHGMRSQEWRFMQALLKYQAYALDDFRNEKT